MKDRSPFVRCVAVAALFPFVVSSCGGGKKPGGGGPTVGMGSASPISDQVLVQTKDLPPGLDLRVSDGKAGPAARSIATKLAPAKKLSDADAAGAAAARASRSRGDAADQQAFALRPKLAARRRAPGRRSRARSRRRRRRCCRRKRDRRRQGPPRAALHARGRGAARARAERDVQPADGRGDVAGRRGGDDAGEADAAAEGHAGAGSARARSCSIPRFASRRRRRTPSRFPRARRARPAARSRTPSKFTFETPPPTLRVELPAGDAPQHARRADVRAVRSEDRSGGGAREDHGDRRRQGAADRACSTPRRSRRTSSSQAHRRAARSKDEHRTGAGSRSARRRSFPPDAAIAVDDPARARRRPRGRTRRSRRRRSRSARSRRCASSARSAATAATCRAGHAVLDRLQQPARRRQVRRGAAHGHARDPRASRSSQSGNDDLDHRHDRRRARPTRSWSSGGVLDEFGQTLGKDATLTFTRRRRAPDVLRPERHGRARSGGEASRRSTSSRRTTSSSRSGSTRSRRRDYDAFGHYLRNQWNHDKPPTLPGKKVFDQLVKTTVGKNELVETRVDLAPALTRSGLGHAIAIVEPYPWKEQLRAAAADRVGAVDAARRSTRTSTATA